MKLNLKRGWYEREVEKEEHLDVTAGFSDVSSFDKEVECQKQVAATTAPTSVPFRSADSSIYSGITIT